MAIQCVCDRCGASSKNLEDDTEQVRNLRPKGWLFLTIPAKRNSVGISDNVLLCNQCLNSLVRWRHEGLKKACPAPALQED